MVSIRNNDPANGLMERETMSHLIDKLNYFRKNRESFSNGHGETHEVNRDWENSYRQR